PPRPSPTLFPYTTLFRSDRRVGENVRTSIAGESVPAPAANDSVIARIAENDIAAARSGEIRVGARASQHRGNGACSNVSGQVDRSEEHTSELQSRSDLVC